MFRGRPHRGGKERGEGLPRHYLPRHSPPPGGYYRDEREDRERHHFSGYRGKHDGYRRSPPGRRCLSPGRSSNRGPRLSPSPLHSSIPLDHSLIITVGNERSHSGSPDHRRVDPPINHRYRDHLEDDYSRNSLPQREISSRNWEDHDFLGGSPHYPHRRGEGPGGSSREREKFLKLHYMPKEAKRPKYDMEPEGRNYSSERSRRPDRTMESGRSRVRSHSWGRSRSRSRDKNRGRSHSASPLKSSLKNDTSEGFRELVQARKRKEEEELERLEREIAQREMAGTVGYGIPVLPVRSTEAAEFRHQRLDEAPPMPKKSILKKRVEPEMDPALSIQSSDYSSGPPEVQQSSNLSTESVRFLNTLSRGMDSELFSSLLREAREETYVKETIGKLTEGSFPYEERYEESYRKAEPENPVEIAGEFLLPHERVSQDGSGFSRILGMMGDFPSPQEKPRRSPDIEDEEKFLYGEEEVERSEAQVQAGLARQQSQPGHSGIVHRQQSHPGMDHQSKPAVGKQHSKTAVGEHQVVQAAASCHQENQPGILLRQNQSGIVHQKESQFGISHHQLIVPRIPSHHLSHPGIGQHQESKSEIGHHQHSHARTDHPQESQPHNAHSQQSQPVSVHSQHGISQEDLNTSPVKGEETQDSKEYEKIQTLLKTIGLDMGVAEISKLAARTQERLHGKKPPAGTSRYSDGEGGRRVSAGRNCENQNSHTKSPESNYNQSISPAPTRRASHGENPSSSFTSEYSVKQGEKKGWEIPVLGENVKPAPVSSASVLPMTAQPIVSLTPSPTYCMPPYSQYQPTPATPNFPPSGYDQYGNYMPYMSTGWPAYPPPSQEPQPGPQQGVVSGHSTGHPPIEEQHVTSSRPYLRVIETVSLSRTKVKPKKDESALVQVPVIDRLENNNSSNCIVLVGQSKQRRESKEKNKANEKQKVIEESVALKKEKEVRLKRKDHLMKELERLRKQQGELLRKKRREKDGHKDPLLVEVNRLQEEVMQQISVIRKEHEAAEKKQAELDKVAQILGLHVSDKPKKIPKDIRETPPEKRKEKPKSPEKPFPTFRSNASLSKEAPILKSAPEKPKSKSPDRFQPPPKSADQYEYYDAGNHWCKNCNTLCGSMFDFFTHMHSKAHRKTQDPYDRPWASKTSKNDKTTEKIVVPAKGSEFLTPVIGFYCRLCEEFCGDQICAEDHVSSCSHNEKYKKYVDENPLHEQRRNLDRQAGLAVIIDNKERRQTELKRKMEEDPKVQKVEEEKAKVMVKEESEEPGSPVELCEKAPTPLKGDSNFKHVVQLRLKKIPEIAKNSAASTTFGKSCLKKSDKEEEKVSEPTTEKEELGEKEDGKAQFGKTKAIAIKLSGETVVPHTSVSVPFSTTPPVASQAKIRPNLPAPAIQLRKASSTAVNKPAPLNAFLSIRPAGTAASKPLPIIQNIPKKDVIVTPDLTSKAFCGDEVVLKTPPVMVVKTPVTTTVTEAKTPEGELKSNTEAAVKSPVPEKKTPSIPHPVMQAVSFNCDVAALDVPASEQNLILLVQPSSLHKDWGEMTEKSEKPKPNLAVANAQDLYMFYSSSGKGSSDVKNEMNTGNTEMQANYGESPISCSAELENKSKESEILFSEVEKKNEKQAIQKGGDETGNVDAGKTNQESIPVIQSPGVQGISSNNVSLRIGIHIDDPLSLTTVPRNKEICGQKILDSLETRTLMSSNTEPHTF
ncbi:zinc finger protein 318-like [Polyodon spathula]|uniref:zinc finger protein 318-like n=1 Tax=Polyodon spathula TaxID=7913 RepID=UPI001B7E63EB|nr:zinc finger protein 318-like [Polyodon spathula]